MVLLLILVALDPELSRFLLIRDHLVQALDSIVQLRFSQVKSFFNTHLLSFQRG